MSSNQFLNYFIIILLTIVFTACEVDSSSNTVTSNTNTPEEIAMNKISNYADNGELSPTVNDYLLAGVSGVNENNIVEINTIIDAVDSNDVDTPEKIQTLIYDSNAPVLTLHGGNPLSITQGDDYEEKGASAIDTRDGNLTESIVTIENIDTETVGSYTVMYSVSDSAGNSADINRTVNVILPEDMSAPVLTLHGDNPLTLIQGDDYEEKGASATDSRDGNLTESIVIIEELDTETVGSYTVMYSVSDSAGNSVDINRTVNVILPADITAPIISIEGVNPLEVTEGDAYTDAGATATDERDGSVDVDVVDTVDSNIIGVHTVTYTAADSSGNSAVAVRTVNVILGADITAPLLTLNGDEEINIGLNQSYIDQKATAKDDRDGDITSDILITGKVDTNTLGVYTLTYTVSDDAGNESSKTRTIHVLRFTRDEKNQIVTDHIEGRMWQDDIEAKTIRLNWENSNLYCNDLSLGGYQDWSLPELSVLKSIVDDTRYPSIDSAFSHILFDNYWSSTLKLGSSFKAWTIRFFYGDGDEVWVSKRDPYSVRCVRNKL